MGDALEHDLGLLGSERIPIAAPEQVDAAYCLRFLRRLRDVAFATVDEEGLPSVRIIDVMHADDRRLYFLVPRGKAFYGDLMRTGHVALVGQTTDFRMCRLRGPVAHPADPAEQRRLVDWLFQLNPGMADLYPGDTRYIIEVFYIEEGQGEYFDLGQKPILRVPFCLGAQPCPGQGGFIVTDSCTGCGTCAAACPQHCIAAQPDGRYAIDQGACLRCGACFEACPFDAIERR